MQKKVRLPWPHYKPGPHYNWRSYAGLVAVAASPEDVLLPEDLTVSAVLTEPEVRESVL